MSKTLKCLAQVFENLERENCKAISSGPTMLTLEEQVSHEAIFFIVSLTARKSKQILMRGLQKYVTPATICDRIVWKSL